MEVLRLLRPLQEVGESHTGLEFWNQSYPAAISGETPVNKKLIARFALMFTCYVHVYQEYNSKSVQLPYGFYTRHLDEMP